MNDLQRQRNIAIKKIYDLKKVVDKEGVENRQKYTSIIDKPKMLSDDENIKLRKLDIRFMFIVGQSQAYSETLAIISEIC